MTLSDVFSLRVQENSSVLAAMSVALPAGDNIPALLKELTDDLHVAVSRFASMRKPLVTAVNGTAAGAGVSLAILGDIVVAAQSPAFTMAYTAIGLSPDGSGCWTLPRLIAQRRAQELMLTKKRISAEEAAAGMITSAVDDDLLAADAMAVVKKLTTSVTLARGRTRNLLLPSPSSSLEDQARV